MEPTLNTFYDIQILMLLAAFAAGAFFVERDRRGRPKSFANRYQTISKIIVVSCMVGFLFVGYGSFIEPRVIHITRAEAPLSTRRLERPIRIALMSDLHLGPYKREGFVQRVANELLKMKPDIVVLAGDLVENGTRTDEAQYLHSLAEVSREMPVFAALGNHDSGLGDELDFLPLPEHEDEVISALHDAGVTVLLNEHRILEIRGQSIAIAGLADIRTGKTDPSAALAGIPPDVPRIIIAHNPDVVRLLDPRTSDLLLAGHTHGGQVRLPFVGPVPRIPTTFGQKVDRGLFTLAGIPVYITSGIGEGGARARLFNPPEIVLLTVR